MKLKSLNLKTLEAAIKIKMEAMLKIQEANPGKLVVETVKYDV